MRNPEFVGILMQVLETLVPLDQSKNKSSGFAEFRIIQAESSSETRSMFYIVLLLDV